MSFFGRFLITDRNNDFLFTLKLRALGIPADPKIEIQNQRKWHLKSFSHLLHIYYLHNFQIEYFHLKQKIIEKCKRFAD